MAIRSYRILTPDTRNRSVSGFDGRVQLDPQKKLTSGQHHCGKNVRKGKAYWAAIKAFSLAKSISTGHSKSFYCIVNDDSSGSSESKLTAIDLDDP